jgi:hypothetical protein
MCSLKLYVRLFIKLLNYRDIPLTNMYCHFYAAKRRFLDSKLQSISEICADTEMFPQVRQDAMKKRDEVKRLISYIILLKLFSLARTIKLFLPYVYKQKRDLCKWNSGNV